MVIALKATRKKLRRSGIDSHMPPRWGSPLCVRAATNLPLLRSSGRAFSRRFEFQLNGNGGRPMRECNSIRVENTQALHLENRARKNCQGWSVVLKSSGGNWPSGAVFV